MRRGWPGNPNPEGGGAVKRNPYVLATPREPAARTLQEVVQAPRRPLAQVVGQEVLIGESMARHVNRALDRVEARAGTAKTSAFLICALTKIEITALREAADVLEARLLAETDPHEFAKARAGENALMKRLVKAARGERPTMSGGST